MPPSPGSTDAAPTSAPGRLDHIDSLDRAVSRRVAVGWPHPRWFTLPLSAFSLTANYGILWYAVCLLPWFFGEPDPLRKALYVAVPVTLVEATGFLIKRVVSRARPPVADPDLPVQIPLPYSKSFPSSHASMSLVAVLTLGSLYPWALPWLALLAAVLCFSRVYLGVHYLGDVLGGVVYGLVFGALWVWLVPLGF